MKHKAAWPRKIIHMDMDAFFAAVEGLDFPQYRDKPIVVGGDPFGRGVVSTASYEARKFGIRSAMPAAQARKLCPRAIFLRPRFRRYQEISGSIMAILRQHTHLMEEVSLDEAYLDVTVNKLGIEDPVMLAKMLKQNIHAVTRLTVSAGVAPNLFLAKIASDCQKPDGLTVVSPDDIFSFLEELPVRKIPGVGPVTERGLKQSQLNTCGDLLKAGPDFLQKKFGKTGRWLYDRARGIDDREVVPEWESKQYSTERTFAKDVLDRTKLEACLRDYAAEIFEELQTTGKVGKTIILKLKYFDFVTITRSKTLTCFPGSAEVLFETARTLLRERTDAGKKSVRLIGLGIGFSEAGNKKGESGQCSFDFH